MRRKFSHLVFVSQFGLRGTRGVLKGVQNSLQNLKMNCLGLFYFWCEHKLLAQTEDIFDALDFL